MPREPLPDRRASWTQKVRIRDAHGKMQTFYLSFGEYPGGRLGEVWVEAQKEGTTMRGVFGTLARTVSVALQCGVPVEEVVKSLQEINFPPNGEVFGSPVVSECRSVPNWIAQEIAHYYGRRG